VSDSYARGGQPRAVPDPDPDPDPDREAYDEMVRKQRALNAKQHGESFWASHPGLGESLVPVWGSAREAIADAHEGDYIGAVGNGILAVTDLAPGAVLFKTAGKGAMKGAWKMGSHSWDATRKWMNNKELAEKGLEKHHAIIPQGGWGKSVPDGIKNQPWNITQLPRETHRRIHTKFKGQPRFPQAERITNGSPLWGKAILGLVPARGATIVDARTEHIRD
jgi:hypothetical protein